MNERINRREFLKMSSAAAVGGAAVMTGCATAAGGGMESAASIGFKADLPKARGPRLVVVGAGTSGLTIAKYAKKEYPQFDVVMVEPVVCRTDQPGVPGRSQFPRRRAQQPLYLLQCHRHRAGPRRAQARHQRGRDRL
jgi:hypothetical protein